MTDSARANYRPTWDEYFLNMCFEVAKRSDDKFIKLGAIITTNNHIIGTGYNDLPRGINDTHIDTYNRDLRRSYVIHAELNAILNCTRDSTLKNTTLYVNGAPCTPCLGHMVNFGITRIVYLDQLVSNNYIENEEQKKIREAIISVNNIEMVPVSYKYNN